MRLSIYIGDDRNARLSDIRLGQGCPANAQHNVDLHNHDHDNAMQALDA